MLGYKYAVTEDRENWAIVTLDIPEDALTNIERSGIVHAQTASYRTNKATVVAIEDIHGKPMLRAVSRDSFKKQVYVVGKVIHVLDYDTDVDNIETTGIHFYLDKAVVLARMNPKDTRFYYSNGQLAQQSSSSNGYVTRRRKWSLNGTLVEQKVYDKS